MKFPGREPRTRYEHLWFSADGRYAYTVETGSERALRARYARYGKFFRVVEFREVTRRS